MDHQNGGKFDETHLLYHTFYEVHKYARNFELPLYFIVEDNGVSTNTPTDFTWNGKKRNVPDDVIWYEYKSKYPHYGTGKWVVF
jgi:hypothetical protein